MRSKVFNLVIFQLCWLTCVLGAAAKLPLAGPAAILLLLTLESRLFDNFERKLKGYCVVAIIGIGIDLIAIKTGAFSFEADGYALFGYPIWMCALWFGFATTFDSSLHWMKSRLWALLLFGLKGGPVAFYAASKLGAINIGPDAFTSYCIIGLTWALIIPTAFYFYFKVLDGTLYPRQLIMTTACIFCMHYFVIPQVSYAESAAEICPEEEVCFPKAIQQGDTTLKYVRSTKFRYLFFDVYTIALYESKEPKGARALAFHYHRKISKDDMIEGADKNLRQNPNVSVESYSSELAIINKQYYDVGEGSRYYLISIPGSGITLRNEQKDLVTVNNDSFAKDYLGIWISEHPLSESLRERLLGLDA